MNGLVLHCGANRAELQQVAEVRTPEPTKTWFPIPHLSLINRVREALTALNMRVVEEAHALAKGGDRYFGLLRVANGRVTSDDFGYVLGLRNSHDREFTASIAVGSNVFVCDNLAFNGEITIARKHTRFIVDDLPKLTGNAIGLLSQRWNVMNDRYARYKTAEMSDSQAHDTMIRALDIEAITLKQLPTVIQEWRQPRHPEFAAARNAWRLFNACTCAAKESSLVLLPQRTTRLHGLIDNTVGFTAPKLNLTAGTVEADAAQVVVHN